MVKLSIIIPFYETYDLTCNLMNEFKKQINKDVEIIIVDDSNDLRLDEFKDIAKIFHNNKKQGVSKARNIGIDNSNSEYIAFVDSDDMISNDYINVLLKTINERDEDIIVFDWMDSTTKYICHHPENYAVWKAIYKREICPRFLEEVEFNEDVFFQEELDKHNYSKYYLDNVLYTYNSNRVNSQMWRRDKKRREDMIKCEVIKKFGFSRFNELEHIERKSIDLKDTLLVGDTFECTKEIADYLLGDNPIKEAVVKVIEVEPTINHNVNVVIDSKKVKDTIKKTTNKKKK